MRQITLICFSSILSASLFAQNVGIGTSSPGYKLDVAGRIRVRHNAGQTAGIWFDGATLANKSFIGTLNDTTFGIYGGGAGWTIHMNTETGYVGINTALPTAELDINGVLRLRGSFPKKGSVLTSNDNAGNAAWADPVAFRVTGLSGGTDQSIAGDAWTQVMFNSTATYNLGLNYQGFLSQFLVAENGIYSFTAQLAFAEHVAMYRGIRLMRNRNGSISTLTQQNQHTAQWTDGVVLLPLDGLLAYEGQLQQGDVVWVEVYIRKPIMVSSSRSYVNSTVLSTNTLSTWFAGHLVARL
jgi:hypothetical protein